MSASFHHPHTYTFREQYSRSILDQYYGGIIPGLSLDTFTPYDIAHSSVTRRNASTVSTSRVGIIGGGVAGLYAAMVLQNLGVQYEILEAQPSHIGGRLYTHHFSDGPNDYYDVGAMRFPNISPMWRTFDLFHRLNFSGKYVYDKNKLQQLSNSTSSRDAGQALATYEALIANVTFTNSSAPAGTDVIDYILSTPEDIQNFNGVSIRRKDSQAAGINSFNTGGVIPESYLSKGVQYWLDAKVGYFRDQLRRNFTSGIDELRQYDAYSTRQLMRTKFPELEGKFTEFMKETYPGQNYTGDVAYPEEVINWIETFSSGTSMYDDALSETVFDELDFNYAPNVTWKAIQGGSHRIALAMVQQLRGAENPRGQILQNKRVTKISPATSNGNQSSGPISVYVEGEAAPRQYDHVISTVALSALRMIDLDDCKLSWQLRESLRELEYGASVKVGIRFTHRWWEQQGQDHRGGISSTDRLSRQIVYPSYGIGSNDATMLASYSWSQDALRLGALVKGKDSLTERRLVDQLLQDLSKVHNITYEDLKSWMVDYHAYSWYHNEYTIGAFALFGPAQFGRMYQAITQPAGNMHLHFAGEAASTNHGWVAGALDSAIRSITQVFYQDGRQDLVNKLQAEWGLVDEMSPEHWHAMQQVALSQNTGMTASNARR